jgi:hypothetical protein
VLANALSHLCRLIHKFSLATRIRHCGATLPSPANFKFLRHIKAWILPLDSSVDNHFCTIDNSISLCTRSLSTIQQTQWQIYSGGYIYSDRYTARYTVPGQDTYSQRRIYRSSSRYTARYTQRRIHGGRYTAADTQ